MYNLKNNFHNTVQSTSVDRHDPDILIPYIEDLEDISEHRLKSFLDPITSDKEPPFDKFTISQLTELLDQNS